MWARIDAGEWGSGGKYHWYPTKRPGRAANHEVLSLCGCGPELYNSWLWHNEVGAPRRANRCKRCVAALKRRKDENA